jgi:hypothetical protein
MVTELPARRDLCDDYLRQATLVDFRGSNLSDAGSIPAISTIQKTSYQAGFLLLIFPLTTISVTDIVWLMTAPLPASPFTPLAAKQKHLAQNTFAHAT